MSTVTVTRQGMEVDVNIGENAGSDHGGEVGTLVIPRQQLMAMVMVVTDVDGVVDRIMQGAGPDGNGCGSRWCWCW